MKPPQSVILLKRWNWQHQVYTVVLVTKLGCSINVLIIIWLMKLVRSSAFLEAKTAKVAFELYLYDNVKRLAQPNKPKGCMLITAAMNGSEQVQDIQHNLLENV